MKSNTHFLGETMNRLVGPIVIGIVVLLFVGCSSEKQEGNTNDRPQQQSAVRKEGNRLVLTHQQVKAVEIVTERAEVKSVPAPLTLPARVALNDWFTAHITARLTGRIEKVHRVAGDHVKGGAPVVELYSQEFLAMQSEFIQAEERFKRMNADQPDYGTARAIYLSAKKKLQIVGMTDREIETLADGHNALTLLPVRAPFDGALLSGEARPGTFVQTGAEFFTIANLQKLWVIADVVENDLSLVSEGLPGDIIVAPYPTEKFRGRLITIIDMVDEKSRTVKVRFEVQNSQEKLKPEMFATVIVNITLGGSNVKVPSSAVMENKDARYVFVAVNDTTFEERPVKIGRGTTAYTEILTGLTPGESVVANGTFFLKSEMAKSAFVEEE